MDYGKLIRDLRIQLDKVNSAIRVLETLHREWNAAPGACKRRGRKFMALEERQRVSAHMKRYWAERRAAREPLDSVARNYVAGGEYLVA